MTPPPTRAERVRQVCNLVNGSTLLGLLLARIGGCTLSEGPYGLTLAEGYRLPFPQAGAFTVGNVVIICQGSARTLVARHPDVLRHESQHAWQWVICLGLPLIPFYLIACLVSMALGEDWYSRNIFERDAGLHAGGYHRTPRRAWARRLPSTRARRRRRTSTASKD